MDHFLSIGAVLGVLFGLAHATHVYRLRVRDAGAAPTEAGWFALWTVVLWTLLGSYLLFLWLIGAAGMAIVRLRRSESALP